MSRSTGTIMDGMLTCAPSHCCLDINTLMHFSAHCPFQPGTLLQLTETDFDKLHHNIIYSQIWWNRPAIPNTCKAKAEGSYIQDPCGKLSKSLSHNLKMLGHSLVIDHLPRMRKDLDLILSTTKHGKWKMYKMPYRFDREAR